MSEYQYYEFQAVDRPLTPEEQAEVSKLSSRTTASAYSATFVYNYSDFGANEEKMLAKYFDALLYLANWGTSRLLFRFSKAAMPAETLKPYCIEDGVSVSSHGKYIILDMSVYEDEPYGWVEGEGWLSPMMQLRKDILNGDYRVPYLAWLKAASMRAGWDESIGREIEPPPPPKLKKSSKALNTFREFFQIDEDLVTAAAEGSSNAPQTQINLEPWIDRLPEDTKADYLRRLLLNEPALHLELKQHLKELADLVADDPEMQGTRTVVELIERSEKIRQERKEKERQRAKAKRNRELDKLADKVPELWEKVFSLIEEKRTRAYDEAIEHLVDLGELSQRDGWRPEFQAKINEIYETYPTLRGLHKRMKKKKLTPKE